MAEYSIKDILHNKKICDEFAVKKGAPKKSGYFIGGSRKKEPTTNFSVLISSALQELVTETDLGVEKLGFIPATEKYTRQTAVIKQKDEDVTIQFNYGNAAQLWMLCKAYGIAYGKDSTRLTEIKFGYEGKQANVQSSDSNNETETEAKDILEEIKDLIVDGGCCQIIFTGAPGTGKTYYAKKIAEKLGSEISEGRNYRLVQFHPSYDYTDFVEGLRPIQVETNQKKEVSFAKVDGTFKAFCRKVVELNEKKGNNTDRYFFVIDEINRANLSKVFGELMFGLERDKRGKNNGFKTQYQKLRTYDIDKNDYLTKEEDCFYDEFYVPENVIIIGTMNDIDRSVDSMDFALRRRFEWREFEVTEKSLNAAFTAKKDNGEPIFGEVIAKNADSITSGVMQLNDKWINDTGRDHGLNKQYYISQGQFTGISYKGNDLNGLMNYIWTYRVESLLREYLRGEDDIDDLIAEAESNFKMYLD